MKFPKTRWASSSNQPRQVGSASGFAPSGRYFDFPSAIGEHVVPDDMRRLSDNREFRQLMRSEFRSGGARPARTFSPNAPGQGASLKPKGHFGRRLPAAASSSQLQRAAARFAGKRVFFLAGMFAARLWWPLSVLSLLAEAIPWLRGRFGRLSWEAAGWTVRDCNNGREHSHRYFEDAGDSSTPLNCSTARATYSDTLHKPWLSPVTDPTALRYALYEFGFGPFNIPSVWASGDMVRGSASEASNEPRRKMAYRPFAPIPPQREGPSGVSDAGDFRKNRPGIHKGPDYDKKAIHDIAISVTPRGRVKVEVAPQRTHNDDTETNEKKTRPKGPRGMDQLMALHKLLNQATEAVDFLEVLAGATGYDGPTGDGDVMEMLEHTIDNIDKFNAYDFVYGLVGNEIEDQAIGRMSGMADATRKNFGLSVDPTFGPGLS